MPSRARTTSGTSGTGDDDGGGGDGGGAVVTAANVATTGATYHCRCRLVFFSFNIVSCLLSCPSFVPCCS